MRRGREQGFVLVGVQVFVVMAFVALAPSYSRLHEALRVEKAAFDTPTGGERRRKALGTALARLQTGLPPADIYSCKLQIFDPGGNKWHPFSVSYEKLTVEEWRVTVVTGVGGSNPDCPSVFGDICPLVGA